MSGPDAMEPGSQADAATTPVNPNLPWQTTYRALLGTVKLGTSRGVKHIQGVDGMTVGQLRAEMDRGGRFVVYPYNISAIVFTQRRTSPVLFIPSGRSRRKAGLRYAAISFLLGWWGIPWGLIYTPGCIITDLRGGHDVTSAIAAPLINHSFAAVSGSGSPGEAG